jgi:hypothetical protein
MADDSHIRQLPLSRGMHLRGRWARWRAVQSHLKHACPHDGIRLLCTWCKIAYSLEPQPPFVVVTNYPLDNDVA